MIPVVTCSYFDEKFIVRFYDYDVTLFKGPLTKENCLKIKAIIAARGYKTVIYSGLLDDPRIGFDVRKAIEC